MRSCPAGLSFPNTKSIQQTAPSTAEQRGEALLLSLQYLKKTSKNMESERIWGEQTELHGQSRKPSEWHQFMSCPAVPQGLGQGWARGHPLLGAFFVEEVSTVCLMPAELHWRRGIENSAGEGLSYSPE